MSDEFEKYRVDNDDEDTFEQYKDNDVDQSPKPPMVNTFLGQLPKDINGQMINNPELIKQLIGVAGGGGETNVAGSFLNEIKPVTKKSIIKNILGTHDALEDEATTGFQEVSKEAKNRGINKIPKSNLMDMDELKDYFPKTTASSNLLGNAQTGDYDALRSVQSDLYTRGKKNLQSDFEADRNRGEEMLDRRDSINKAIQNHFLTTGNPDLAETLNKSRNNWRTLQDTYYNKNISPSIQKLVDRDIRKVPSNLTKTLNEESIPMQKLRDFHPGLEGQLKKYGLQKQISSALLKYGLSPAIIGGVMYEAGKRHTTEE